VLAVLGLSVMGLRHGGVIEGIVRIWGDPWGPATLADLACGVLLVGAWMIVVEARPRRLWLWLPLLILLGHAATGLFLLARLPRADNLRTWLSQRL